jgi:hypothetical protein
LLQPRARDRPTFEALPKEESMRARLSLLAAVVGAGVGLGVLSFASPAMASHHLWRFNQLYSNASGSVQFVELTIPPPTEDGEQATGGVTVVSGSNVVTLTNLPSTGTSTHSWILLATSNFASLPGGITPDFVIPANFFPTGGGTLNYANGQDTWTFGAVPTDGRNALHKMGTTVTTSVNSPENFAIQSGSVNLSSTVPGLPRVFVGALVAALLLAGSGLLRRARRA